MKKYNTKLDLFLMGLVVTVCALILGCNAISSEQLTNTQQSFDLSQPKEGHSIPLPIEGIGLANYNESLLIIGNSEYAIFYDQMHPIKNFKFSTNVISNFSTDGGLTTSRLPNSENPSTQTICSSEKALIRNKLLFLIGPCEHTSQFWLLPIDRIQNKSFLMNFTYSTFPNSNSEDKVYSPIDIFNTPNDTRLLINTDKGPGILSINIGQLEKERIEFLPIWFGNRQDGKVLASDFTNDLGWLVTSSDLLFKTIDYGKNWKIVATTPSCSPGLPNSLFMRNDTVGYLFCTSGKSFRSLDSGKTWTEMNLGITDNVEKVDSVAGKLIILTNSGKVLVESNDQEMWTEFLGEGELPINDILVIKNQLFILSFNKLSVVDFGDIK